MWFIFSRDDEKKTHLYWKSSLPVKLWAREDVSLSNRWVWPEAFCQVLMLQPWCCTLLQGRGALSEKRWRFLRGQVGMQASPDQLRSSLFNFQHGLWGPHWLQNFPLNGFSGAASLMSRVGDGGARQSCVSRPSRRIPGVFFMLQIVRPRKPAYVKERLASCMGPLLLALPVLLLAPYLTPTWCTPLESSVSSCRLHFVPSLHDWRRSSSHQINN